MKSGGLSPTRLFIRKLIGHIEAAEASEAMEQVRQLVDQSDEVLVHVISDMTENTYLPKRIAEAKPIMDRLLSHKQLGWVVIYGQDRFIGFVAQLLGQLFRTRFPGI